VPSYWPCQLSQALACYNVQVEDDEDDPGNINIPEFEGSHEVRYPEIEDPDIMTPLKTKQVNIGTEEEPKYATLRTTGTMPRWKRSSSFSANTGIYSLQKLRS